MNWFGRLDVIVLALMLTYAVAVATRVVWRYHLARRARGMDDASRNRAKLVVSLSREVGSLKSIAFTAPYLGLMGTCAGILSAFGGIDMQWDAALAMMASEIAAALVTTAAGILVAVPATILYNYLHTRLDLLESEVSSEAPKEGSRHSQVAQGFPLTKRFSELPAFALITASGLAILVAAFTPFSSFHRPKGFGVEVVSDRCQFEEDPQIFLHISSGGKLSLNSEQEEWDTLASRLSEVYSIRAHRTLYLLGDDDVPFQMVADAIDIVQNPNNLSIKLKLVTPKALRSPCPVATNSGQHVSKGLLKISQRHQQTRRRLGKGSQQLG